MFLEFVVPAERAVLTSRQSQRRRPRGDFDHARPRAGAAWRARGIWLAEFAVDGQLVQHVGQRFGMHQAMFDGHVQQAAMFEAAPDAGLRRSRRANRSVQLFAQPVVVFANSVARRPILRLVGRQAAIHRIDAKRKELVKAGSKEDRPRRCREKIPVESFQMPKIKNNPMAFRDGPVVQVPPGARSRTARRCARARRASRCRETIRREACATAAGFMKVPRRFDV